MTSESDAMMERPMKIEPRPQQRNGDDTDHEAARQAANEAAIREMIDRVSGPKRNPVSGRKARPAKMRAAPQAPEAPPPPARREAPRKSSEDHKADARHRRRMSGYAKKHKPGKTYFPAWIDDETVNYLVDQGVIPVSDMRDPEKRAAHLADFVEKGVSLNRRRRAETATPPDWRLGWIANNGGDPSKIKR